MHTKILHSSRGNIHILTRMVHVWINILLSELLAVHYSLVVNCLKSSGGLMRGRDWRCEISMMEVKIQ